MSIQTELTRLANAKAAIQTAIEGKGVTVPSGTLLDGMAALIESIEAGGLPGFYTGTITGTGEEGAVTIENAFTAGEAPRVIILYEEHAANSSSTDDSLYYPKAFIARNDLKNTASTTKSTSFYTMYYATKKSGNSVSSYAKGSGVNSYLNGSASKNYYQTVRGTLSNGALSVYCEGIYGIRAGLTYRWLAIAEDTI